MAPESGDSPTPTPADPDDTRHRLLDAARHAAASAEDKSLPPLTVLTPTELEKPLPSVGAPIPGSIPVIEGYTDIREISRGGQAVVFEAVKQSTGRHVAVKIIFGGPLASRREQARFEREADILAGLNHPNIVGIIDRGRTSDGSLYLVMDYVPGPTLDEYVETLKTRPGGVDPAELLALFVKIAGAVFAAHQRGVVHRDLKPSNIRVHPSGEPYLLDFGLARPIVPAAGASEAETVTVTGQFVGSLAYASPEQAEGRTDQVDVRSDVYSLGVMLYRMVTGQFPYVVVGSMPEVLQNILTAEPTPPSRVVDQSKANFSPRRWKLIRPKSVPQALEAVVLKALRKRPEDRYADAGELAGDVRSFLDGLPTVALRQAQRSRLYRNAAAVAAVLVTGVVSLAAYEALPRSAPRPIPVPTTAPAIPASAPLSAQDALAQGLRDGTTQWRGHSYLIVTQPATFDEAVNAAKKYGGHLAVIDSVEKHGFMGRFIHDMRKRTNQNEQVNLWLGMLSDVKNRIQTVEGDPLTFKMFPRRLEAADQLLPVRTMDTTWTVAAPNSRHGFIVEWDKVRADSTLRFAAPWDAVAFGKFQYKLFTQSVTWRDAIAQCRKMDGALYRIISPEEEAFIAGDPKLGGQVKEPVWLGAEVINGKMTGVMSRLKFQRFLPTVVLTPTTRGPVLWTPEGWTLADESKGPVLAGFICEWKADP